MRLARREKRQGGRATSTRSWLTAAGLAAAYCAVVAIGSGQDVNWDRQNYHLYDAFALLHWRYPSDVMPGGPQTTLNPIPYLIPYLLEHGCGPRAGAVRLAGLQSIPVLLGWCIAARIARTGWSAAIAGATAATSAMVVGAIGTSFDPPRPELLLAAPTLAALLVLTPRRSEAGFDAGRARVLAAGLLTGIAVGFKIALLPLAFGLTSGLVAISSCRRDGPVGRSGPRVRDGDDRRRRASVAAGPDRRARKRQQGRRLHRSAAGGRRRHTGGSLAWPVRRRRRVRADDRSLAQSRSPEGVRRPVSQPGADLIVRRKLARRRRPRRQTGRAADR